MTHQNSFLKAVKWAYAGVWGDRAFSALFVFILAAILGPRNFGLLSIAMIYILFFQMFLDQGLMAALIQKKNLEQGHLDAVFWMDIVLSLLLVAVSIWLSGWWGDKYHAPELKNIIAALSLCIPLEATSAVQATILRRNMDFKGLAIRSNVAVLTGGAVGTAMALGGFGVWALVGQQLVKDLTALVAIWRLSQWRPTFAFSWGHLVDLADFSIWTFVAQLANFLDTHAAPMLLGLFLGPVAVGLYRLADRLAGSVVSLATSSIQVVSLPEFCRHQENPEQLRRSALSCIRISSVVTFPTLAGLAAVSKPLMLALGSNWIPATGVLQVLSLMAAGAVLIYFTGPMLQALSQTRRSAVLEWCRTIVGAGIVLSMAFALRHRSLTQQLMGIASARAAVVALLVAPTFLYVLMRLCGLSLGDLAKSVTPSLVASAAVVGAVLVVQVSGVLGGARPWVSLLVQTSSGFLMATCSLSLLDKSIRKEILAGVKALVRRSEKRDAAILETCISERERESEFLK
jgi:O-antigen/teichoic acid export membrane protein